MTTRIIYSVYCTKVASIRHCSSNYTIDHSYQASHPQTGLSASRFVPSLDVIKELNETNKVGDEGCPVFHTLV